MIIRSQTGKTGKLAPPQSNTNHVGSKMLNNMDLETTSDKFMSHTPNFGTGTTI
ncbi:hypothetical protein GCM10007872_00230 [Gluconobacter sphaericus NBRC 12467]|uniref:Uncharacterized protein n=1 Tax=Gluconobacter sphaericus NBRC 12467 TaxID=1307951 RepID=A0AA37SG58_9PROT|nr:hypothetical protein GSP01_21660 [Gluconobacter sphaericus NBRC 12467]GLQ83115.1 hypothetical protein GCM10007872_00230 [Gluconobacter sphaericus NBRC 12467]